MKYNCFLLFICFKMKMIIITYFILTCLLYKEYIQLNIWYNQSPWTIGFGIIV